MTEAAAEKARQGLMREALADVLLDRAVWTHARLTAGRQHGVDLHEETITQDLLLDIARALPDLQIKTYTRAQEARIGGDWQWDWWFGGYRWFGLRLQAKRLKRIRRKGLGYDLGYRVGARRTRQVDLLTEGARRDNMDAAYVLYNGPDLDLTFDWVCHRLPASAPFFGVSILPAEVARQLADANTRDLATVAGHARPWSCLATCPFGGCTNQGPWRRWPPDDWPDGVERDLAEQVAASFHRIAMQSRYRQDWGPQQEQRLYQRVQAATTPDRNQYIHQLLDTGNIAAAPRQVMAVTIFDETRRRA
ncbi:hypothetical protein [Phytohabitans kaempferiae]|uniref:Uncharacterized protein n=1 Tax=Phytohabitans kaempferiae TaxID=1620943 RepID=A0ABV6LUM6_9ACTN